MVQFNTIEAIDVANWFISKAEKENSQMGLAKLNKLVFYAHGWCLCLYNMPLVTEHIIAMSWGPSFPSIYEFAGIYGSGPITSKLGVGSVADGDPRVPLLERIWVVYGSFSAEQLSRLVCELDGPWFKTIKENRDRRGATILDKTLKDYFGSLAKYH
jgi:uncharacterized phage-associated protein